MKNFFIPEQRRPIVILGAVTETSAKIFVADVVDFSPTLRGCGDYRIQILSSHGYSFHLFTLDNLPTASMREIEILTSHGTRRINIKTNSPDSSSLNFLVGSCNLHTLGLFNNPNKPYRTLNNLIEENSIDFMLHLGDQIYADIPNPFFSPTFKHYANLYFDAWSDCGEANKLLGSVANYMILDDHEIVNNYANKKDKKKYANGIEAYKIFQHSHNPVSMCSKGYHYSFKRGVYPFYVMDTRLERTVKNELMIAENQENQIYKWLIQNIDAPFKFLCTSVPFLTHLVRTDHDSWTSQYFKKQRNRILQFIADHHIRNVVFLSADVHCSMITEGDLFSRSGYAIKIHEIVSSPINQLQLGFPDQFKKCVFEVVGDDTKLYTNIESIFTEASNIIQIELSDMKLKWKLYRTRKANLELEGIIHAII